MNKKELIEILQGLNPETLITYDDADSKIAYETGSNLTMEGIRQAIEDWEKQAEEMSSITRYQCKKYGELNSEVTDMLFTRFRTFPDGIFACCDKCLFGDFK